MTAPDTVKIRPFVTATESGLDVLATGPGLNLLEDAPDPNVLGCFGAKLGAGAAAGNGDLDGRDESASGRDSNPVMKSRCASPLERS
jgi:hypothetical protein